MNERAGSIPPITSITRSMSGRDTSAWTSVVNRLRSSPGRSLSSRRTPMPTRSSGRPIRACRSAACSVSSRATSEPTTPQPSSASRSGAPSTGPLDAAGPGRGSTLSGTVATGGALVTVNSDLLGSGAGESSPSGAFAAGQLWPTGAYGRKPYRRETSPDIQREQVLDRLPAQQGADPPVADSDHRRPRDVVVVAGHRPAVRAGGRHGQEVTVGDVRGQELVADQNVAPLAVFADHPRQRGRGLGSTGGQRCGVLR